MSGPVVWNSGVGAASWADVRGVRLLVVRHAAACGGARPLYWSAEAQWREWHCTSRHPTEADARAACERLAGKIAGHDTAHEGAREDT